MANDSAATDPVRAAVGARIRKMRRERGMTQVQLCRATGLLQPYLSRAEAGEQNLELLTLARLAAALGTSISDLVSDVTAADLTAST